MRINQTPFDEEARKRFPRFELTPDENAWDKLVPHIKQEPKRNRLFVWWLVGGAASLMLIGCGVWSFLVSNHEESRSEVVSIEISKQENQSIPFRQGIETSTIQAEFDVKEEGPSLEQEVVHSDQASAYVAPSKKSKNTLYEGVSSTSTLIEVDRKTRLSFMYFETEKKEVTSVPIFGETIESNSSHSTPFKPDKFNAEVSKADQSFQTTLSSPIRLTRTKGDDALLVEQEILNGLEGLPLILFPIESTELGPTEKIKLPQTWTPSFRVSSSVTRYKENYKAKSSSDAAYRNLRDSSSTLLISPTVSARYEIRNQSGLFAYAGVEYALQTSENYVNVLIGDSTYTTQSYDLLNQTLTGTNTYLVEEIGLLRVYNRYHIVTAQAGVGYKHKINRFYPYALVNGGYEVLVRSSGLLPNQVNEAVSLEDTKGWVNTRPGWQNGATLGVDVDLNAKWGIGIHSTWLNRGSVAGDLDPLRVKRTSLSAGLSLLYSW